MLKNILGSTFLFIITVSIISCGGEKKAPVNKMWDNTQKINVSDRPLNLKIPNGFKRSTRFGVKDLTVSKNRFALDMHDKLVKSFNFDNATVDYYVDTTAQFRVLTFVNIKEVLYKKEIETQVNNLVSNNYTYIADRTKGLKVDEIDLKSKSTDKLRMLKFKHKMTKGKNNLFNSVYYVTTPIQTIWVYETNLEDGDIEDYLWSIRDI